MKRIFICLFLLHLHFSFAQNEITSHLLPSDLPIKKALDVMFKKARVILNSKTLKKAKFTDCKPRKFTRIIVTKHEDFPGYIFKLFLDAQRYKSDTIESEIFLNRIKGASKIAALIEREGLEAFFKVPKKWIYPLPKGSKADKDFPCKNFILVEEDMDLLDAKANIEAWKSVQVTSDLLVHLYTILKEVGLRDCAKIENIPFSKDGKIAFIDTESFGYDKVPFKRLKNALSPEMRPVWETIIKD